MVVSVPFYDDRYIFLPRKRTVMSSESNCIWQQDCWLFRLRRLDDAERSAVASGVRRLAQVSGCDYSPVCGLFRRYRLARCNEWRFVMVQTAVRPPRRQIVAFDDHSLCLPTCRPDERAALLRTLNVSSLDDMAIFHQMVSCDYGVVDKGTAPIILRNSAVAKQCGIESLSEYGELLQEGFALCWQRWGGFVYAFRVDLSASDPFIAWERIAVAVGDFRRLPVWLVR